MDQIDLIRLKRGFKLCLHPLNKLRDQNTGYQMVAYEF